MSMIGNIPFTQVVMQGPFGPQHIANVQINVPPNLLQLVVPYAVGVLNTAYAATPQSYGRKFFFNLIVQNNFNNQALNATVELAFRIAWFNLIRRSFPSLDHPSAIEMSCQEALAVLTAEQILSQPMLQQGLNPDAVNGIRQTYQAFQNSRGQYYQLTFTELQNVNGAPSTVNYAAGSTVAQQPINTTIAVAGSLGGVNLEKFSEWDQQSKPGTETSATGQGPVLSQATYSQGESVIPPTPMGEVKPQESQAPAVEVLKPPQKPLYESFRIDRPTYTTRVVSHRGFHEMDVNRHAIPYFGQNGLQGFNSQASLTGLKSDAFDMHHRNASQKPKNDRLTVEELSVQLSLADLFSQVRMHQRRLTRKYGRELFLTRLMGVVMNHAPSGRIMHDLVPSIYDGDMATLGRRLAVAVDCSDQDNPTPAQHDRLVSAAFIDRQLGLVTNDFLARGLRLPSTIQTFSDSIGDCSAYIKNSLPAGFGVMFNDFLNTLIYNLKFYATPENLEGVMEMVYGGLPEGEEVDENDGIVVVPIGHTVTLVNLTSKELGWRMDYRGSNIDPKVTPTLDDIVTTLRADKSAFNFKSTYDWLLTGDGETYLVYESPEDIGNFRLFPVSGLNINSLKTIDS